MTDEWSDPRVEQAYRKRQSHDYDIDKRFAHIRVKILGQEYTDVVRVCEQFPGLPDGITVYVEHVDAIDLKSNNDSEPERCYNCKYPKILHEKDNFGIRSICPDDGWVDQIRSLYTRGKNE